MKIWPFFQQSHKPCLCIQELKIVVQNPQRCVNFQLVPRLFPKDGWFGVYFKISTSGNIRMAVIIGWLKLYIKWVVMLCYVQATVNYLVCISFAIREKWGGWADKNKKVPSFLKKHVFSWLPNILLNRCSPNHQYIIKGIWFALLCVFGACHSFFLYAIKKKLGMRYFCHFFGPLPSGPSDFWHVLKNLQSWFYLTLKMTSELMMSGNFFFNQ